MVRIEMAAAHAIEYVAIDSVEVRIYRLFISIWFERL